MQTLPNNKEITKKHTSHMPYEYWCYSFWENSCFCNCESHQKTNPTVRPIHLHLDRPCHRSSAGHQSRGGRHLCRDLHGISAASIFVGSWGKRVGFPGFPYIFQGRTQDRRSCREQWNSLTHGDLITWNLQRTLWSQLPSASIKLFNGAGLHYLANHHPFRPAGKNISPSLTRKKNRRFFGMYIRLTNKVRFYKLQF